MKLPKNYKYKGWIIQRYVSTYMYKEEIYFEATFYKKKYTLYITSFYTTPYKTEKDAYQSVISEIDSFWDDFVKKKNEIKGITEIKVQL